MTLLELCCYQYESIKSKKIIGYKTKELTKEKVAEESLIIWVFNNLGTVFLENWQGRNKLKLTKKMFIKVSIDTQNANREMHYICRRTQDETIKTFSANGHMYALENTSNHSPINTMHFTNILNAIEYSHKEKYKNLGPESPNPFRN